MLSDRHDLIKSHIITTTSRKAWTDIRKQIWWEPKQAAVLIYEEDNKSMVTMKDTILEMENFNYDKNKLSDEDYNVNLSDLSANFVSKICDSINN
jgi:hypothetical protein